MSDRKQFLFELADLMDKHDCIELSVANMVFSAWFGKRLSKKTTVNDDCYISPKSLRQKAEEL